MRLVLHTNISINGLLVLIQDELHLFRVEINATCFHAFFAQFGRQAVERQDFVLVVAWTVFYHGLHFLIGITAARLDDGLANPFIINLGLFVHLENDTESQFLLVGTQRTDVVAKFLGQHGDGAVDKINARAAVESFLVDGGAFLHIIRHVGDMDTYFPMAIG